jgi:hypothetical protein
MQHAPLLPTDVQQLCTVLPPRPVALAALCSVCSKQHPVLGKQRASRCGNMIEMVRHTAHSS